MFTKHVLAAGLALGAGACSTGGDDPLGASEQAISNAPGIDVSQFQGTINWSQVRAAGTQFAIIKSGGMFTSGTTYSDPRFATNWSQARAAGVIRGAYFYFQPAFDGVTQGNALVNQINAAGGLQTGDLPPAIDIELNAGNTVWDPVTANNLAHLQQWLTTVQNAFGKKPYIYTNQSTWSFLGNPQTFSGYPLWVANPGSTSPAMPAGGWPTWTFWQNRVESGGVGTVTGMPQASGLDHDVYTGHCDNNIAVGATACASQGDSVQYRCQFGSTPGASLWSPESCNGGTCSGSSCTSASIPPCGTGLFCAGNQIPGSSACTSNAQTIFCCPAGQTIVNGACSGTSTQPLCSANCGGGGWWCAGDGACIVNGVAGHNYHCPGNNVAPDRDQACANGCVTAPAGSPDYCRPTSFCGGGSWCGNDCVNGYPRTLYTFTSSGAVSSVTQCETGFASQTCTIAPAGSPDHCN